MGTDVPGCTEDRSHPEHVCERCHGSNVTWFAPSELWNATHGDFDILCPVCFITLAEQAGVLATAWRIAPEDVDAQAEIIRLRAALAGLESMYAATWDRVDGALVMMPPSITRFEAAHKKAREALGIYLVEIDDEEGASG
jgi:hypothetical protein